jgi:tetratricopeptide (TPR) repeat protein
MMARFEFIFWEAVKALALLVLALLAVKAVRTFTRERRRSGMGLALYGVIVVLAALGARTIGVDIAAEVYDWVGEKNLDRHQWAAALGNALRAVELRPGVVSYWDLVARAKFSTRQYASLLRDEPVFRALNPRGLGEDDLMRFAYCRLFLGQYQEAIPLADEVIRLNPGYPKSYVLEGLAEVGLRRYEDAERNFLKALQILPTQADAVEGLAHAYFLMGSTDRALAVLDTTARYSFPAEARERFQALKALYEQ